MNKKVLSESDICDKFIRPAMESAGWDRLSRELIDALEQSEVRDRITAAGGEPRSTMPEQFRAVIDDEIKRWARVIKDAGIRVEG